jgi:nitroreductase
MYSLFEMRHSIRKFKPESIPEDDLIAIIKAGAMAPSGHNEQNWHFVLISNKNLINQIADIVGDKNESIALKLKDPSKFRRGIRFYTLFRGAPHLLLVFSKRYSPTGLNELIETGAPKHVIDQLIQTSPGIQGAAAAMENIQLASASLGYGGVWMTGPLFAATDIEKLINLSKEEYHLVAMSPLGIPLDSEKSSPQKKPLEEVFTHIK